MTPQEITASLAAPYIAVVATISRNGMPQLTPNGYRYDGRVLTLITRTDRLKYFNLQRNNRIPVCIDDPPVASNDVVISGTATFTDHDIWDEARRIIARYRGSTEVDDYLARWKAEPRVLITGTPERIATRERGDGRRASAHPAARRVGTVISGGTARRTGSPKVLSPRFMDRQPKCRITQRGDPPGPRVPDITMGVCPMTTSGRLHGHCPSGRLLVCPGEYAGRLRFIWITTLIAAGSQPFGIAVRARHPAGGSWISVGTARSSHAHALQDMAVSLPEY
jgi:PPOX class probable F420-dependent enzyme